MHRNPLKTIVHEINLYHLITSLNSNIKDKKINLCGKTFSFEGSLQTADVTEGKSLSIQVGSTLWEGEDSIIILINDISSAKNFNEKLRIHKDNLLASISHELRTPLNGILGSLEVAHDEQQIAVPIDKIEVAIVSARLLSSLINDILDMSLISEGKLTLQMEKVNLGDLIFEIIKILKL